MDHPQGARETGGGRLGFDRRVRLEFRGTQLSSDGGLLVMRELDDVLGLSDLASGALNDSRRGKNTVHRLDGLFRQSVFGRLAGYEDVNDADRLALDPVMRQVVGGRAVDAQAASASQMGRFETEILTLAKNREALADLNGQWIDRLHDRNGLKYIVLDMDSPVSPTHGDQAGSAWNGHFDCTLLPPQLSVQPVRHAGTLCLTQWQRPQRRRLARWSRSCHCALRAPQPWRPVLPRGRSLCDPRDLRTSGRGRLLLRHPAACQQRLAREDRALAHAARGATFADQGQTVLRGFRLSGGVLGQGTPGDRQDRMASGRVVPACRLHRHQPADGVRLGGAVL